MKINKRYSSPKTKRLGEDVINNFAYLLKKENDKIKFERLL